MEDGRNTHASPTGQPPDEPNGGPGFEPHADVVGEAKIGRALEGRRRERGLSLEEVEQATKIRKRYLMGLEREDYSLLPDAVYASGFLKTYANFLGLDGEALSQQLRNRRKPRRERGINYSAPRSDFERPLITPGGVAGTEKRRVSTSAIITLVVAILALAAVIGTLYYVGRGVEITASETYAPPGSAKEGPREAPSAEGPETKPVNRKAAAGDASPAGEGAAERPARPDALLVSVRVLERPSWLLVRADGVLAYEETAPPGFAQTFEAERSLSITSGDAGAVTVEVNGQDAGALGGAGEVVTENFTLKSAS